MDQRRAQLNVSAAGTMPASGAVTVTLGPSSAHGSPFWDITKIQVRNQSTARRGKPPIPTCNVYVDQQDASGWQDGTYDGSFDASDVDLELNRGQQLIAVWEGGQIGDVMEISVSGWKG